MNVAANRIQQAISEAERFAGWEEPLELPAALPPVPPFEVEMLPAQFATSALEISDAKQAPIDFIAAAYLVALSSLVARTVAIRPMRETDWSITPNLWGLIVGRPAAKKSPAMSSALRPLDSLEQAASESFDAAMSDYGLKQQLHTHAAKARNCEIQKLLKKRDKQSQSDAYAILEEQEEGQPQEPVCTRYIVNDTTAEKLADLLQGNPSILVCRDELQGFFASLERHGQEGARSFYLESWNGDKPFKVDRISRGSITVPRACVSVLGGIQPGPLGSLLREFQQSSRVNDGLLQRFQVAVWPDLPQKFRLVDCPPDAENRLAVSNIFAKLSQLDPSAIGAEAPKSGLPFLRFSGSAQPIYLKWLEDHENRIRQEEMAECMEAHLGKYQSLVPSIALVLHLADGSVGPVGDKCLLKAIAWSRYLEAHARRIYAPIVGADFVAARALGRKIRSGDLGSQFSLREVYRHGWANLSTPAATRVAAEVLEDFGWIERVQQLTDGRSATVYTVNPWLQEVEH